MPRNRIPGRASLSINDPRHQAIPFESVCPICLEVRPQRGFSRGALSILLNGGHPIVAYCVTCHEFWPLGPDERAAIAELIR